MATGKSGSRTARRTYPEQIPPLEWATAGLGLILLVGLLFLLLHNAFAGPKGPPRIEVEVRNVQTQNGGHLVLFEAHNRGGTTASSLALVGELRKGDAVLETSRAEIDELPPGSHRSGGMFFKRDPGAGQLSVRPESFQDP